MLEIQPAYKHMGLDMGWKAGYKKVEAVTDFLVAYNLIKDAPKDHAHFSLVWKIHNLLWGSWECKLSHYWWEDNMCADALAKKSLNTHLDVTSLPQPLDELKPILWADTIKVAYNRSIAM